MPEECDTDREVNHGAENNVKLADQVNDNIQSSETKRTFRFVYTWVDQFVGFFTSFYLDFSSERYGVARTSGSPGDKLRSLSKATNEFIVKQREEEVTLEPFISNPFLMSVCHLRAILNQYRDD